MDKCIRNEPRAQFMANRSIRLLAPMISIVALCIPAVARADMSPLQVSFDQAIARGPVWTLLAAFIGGLLVSLTPCVYPMIAITVSVFGARKAQTRREAAALSGVFVLGIALMFTALGVGAALSGSLFGSLLSNKLVVCFVALVLIALSASMFGAFELALPAGLTMRLSTVGGVGYAGAFAL